MSGWVKIQQITYAMFETTSQFFFKLCINLQCHERWLFCTFLAETVHDLDKRNPSKCKTSYFRLLKQISPNLYFDRFFLIKVYKISAKKVQRSYVSWPWRVVQNLKKNWFVVSKMKRRWWILNPYSHKGRVDRGWWTFC